MHRVARAVAPLMRQAGARRAMSTHLPLTYLSEEEEMFKDAVAKFAADVCLPKAQKMDAEGEMDDEVTNGLFENGLLGIEIPEEYGGSGASFMNVCLTIEALSRVDPVVGLLCDLQNTVVNNVFVNFGTDEQKQKYLPRLCSNMIGSFCLSEAGSGSDAFALKTRAEKSADGSYYTLNGQKMWISNAEYAGVYLVFANIDHSKGYKGITCFIVDRDMEGLEIGKPEDKLGIRASSTCPVFLNNVKVPATQILGEVGKGYKIAISTLNEGRIGIASQMLGLAQGVYDQTMPYLFDRQQFGSAIGDFQAMQHQYAECALDIEATRLLVYNAARMKDAGAPFVKNAAMAKLHASRVAERTASKCIEMLGGVGFTKHLLVEKFFRDSKIGSIYEGTSNMQLSTIAKIVKEDFLERHSEPRGSTDGMTFIVGFAMNDAMEFGFAAPPLSGNHAAAYAKQVDLNTPTIAISLAGLLFFVLASTFRPIVLVLTFCGYGVVFSIYLCNWVLAKDDGTPEMRDVSTPIREGAEGFLRIQYSAIARIAVGLALLIFFSYALRATSLHASGVEVLGNTMLGVLGAMSFLLGAVCSAGAGYISMWVSAQSNIRVASAARRSYGEALLICFRGGAFSAVLDITLCVAGVSILYVMLYMVFGSSVAATDIPMLMVGYGFGASFVALFMQLGGGIYTKAADVGADLVGKVEVGIPEDDPRNPAVIADLVGDMVGDCVGSSADVFESVAAEIIGAMILGGSLAKDSHSSMAISFVFFPVVVHAFDIVVSSIGIMCVTAPSAHETNPMTTLQRGYTITLGLALAAFALTTRWLLHTDVAPSAWFNFFLCGVVGMVTAFVFVKSTQYYTDYAHAPVRSIAKASTTGHGTNIITGVAVGMKSTVIPTIMVSFSVIAAYHLGASSGVGGANNRTGGLFGTAVATMGMLSSAVFVLAMNNYGPIADNAGGIAEMSGQPDYVRDATDKLDAAGNVTKAITKGYSIGSAALACFVLFGAFMDEFSAFAGVPFKTVDIATVEVLVGGLLGTMMVFFFTGLAVAAVGDTAGEVVLEVRRQFEIYPGIMEYKQKPDYRTCVALVTKAALKQMRLPGLLAVLMPVAVGLIFRFVGSYQDKPLLGAEVLAGYLMFGTVTGIMMALFLDNVGGAWDNAKKYVELGNFGGKGSEAHKAAVTGDTVGDPFKDTAGPALHVVIKLLSTTVLVLGPLFVTRVSA